MRSGQASLQGQEYTVAEEVIDAELLPGTGTTIEKIKAHKMWIETLKPWKGTHGLFEKTNVTSANIQDSPRGMFG